MLKARNCSVIRLKLHILLLSKSRKLLRTLAKSLMGQSPHYIKGTLVEARPENYVTNLPMSFKTQIVGRGSPSRKIWSAMASNCNGLKVSVCILTESLPRVQLET